MLSERPEILLLEEEDPRRPALEALIQHMAESDLRALWQNTRRAGAAARAACDMDRLIRCTRGTKTLQRIAGERGILLHVRAGREPL